VLQHRASRRWNRLVAVLALIVVAVVSGPAGSAADTQSSPWSTPTPIVTGLAQAGLPSIAYSREGIAHAVWESSGALYYTYQLPNRPWSNPVRVASGLSPSMVIDAKGELHALFANQFNGNYEIYYICREGGTWSLPINVSHTSGSSGNPVLALAADGTLHGTWMDNTPGYWTIYHGIWSGVFWSSQPVPYARGQVPSMAASPAGTIFLAWQDKVPTVANPNGEYDVLASELTGGNWSLPVNVSDSPGVESLAVSVAATQDGLVHATWVDQGEIIQYCYGRDILWSQPQVVWSASSPAHAPRITADSVGYLSIVWDQLETIWTTRERAMPAAWPKPVLVASPIGSVRGVTIALLPASGVTIGWVQAVGPGGYSLYTTWQATGLQRRTWMPLLTR
jgi:hypothetical protein